MSEGVNDPVSETDGEGDVDAELEPDGDPVVLWLELPDMEPESDADCEDESDIEPVELRTCERDSVEDREALRVCDPDGNCVGDVAWVPVGT